MGVGMCMHVCWRGWGVRGVGAGGSGVLSREGRQQSGETPRNGGAEPDLGLGQQGPECLVSLAS